MARSDRQKLDFDAEDDGRTIADMSGVERPSLFGHIPGEGADYGYGHGDPAGGVPSSPGSRHRGGFGGAHGRREQERLDLTPEERRLAVWQALKYSLAIGSVYVVGLGLLILLLLWLWGAFAA